MSGSSPKPCNKCGSTDRYPVSNRCRACQKRRNAERDHKTDSHRQQSARWKVENPEYQITYRATHKTEKAQWQKRRRRTDVRYRLAQNIQSRTWNAVRNSAKAGSAVRDLGCSIEELKVHLEKQFQKGMTWGNWSATGWHIDHIVPLSSFDLTDRDQFLKACHYSNLQPMWAKANLSKKNRRDG